MSQEFQTRPPSGSAEYQRLNVRERFNSDEERRAWERNRKAAWRKANPEKVKRLVMRHRIKNTIKNTQKRRAANAQRDNLIAWSFVVCRRFNPPVVPVKVSGLKWKDKTKFKVKVLTQKSCVICGDKHTRETDVCSSTCKTRVWRKQNPERMKATRTSYRHRITSQKINLRLLAASRTKIYKSLKGKVKKSVSTEALIGCTVEALKLHLQAQFKPGMAWNNYGLWHVDHIRPCASFDLTDESQQRACFHFTNLQPLWAIENMVKGDRIQQQATP
jgi:hypothetical protein